MYKLSYVKSGVVEFVFDGKNYEVRRGGSILIRPQTSYVYRIKAASTDITTLFFGFTNMTRGDQACCRISSVSMEEFMKFVSNEEEYGVDSQPFMVIRGNNRHMLAQMVERIHYESSRDQYAKDLMMQLLSTELVIVVARALKDAWEESLLVRNGKAKELVHIAKQYILDNYDDNITVADVAGYVFLSQGYFARAFREEMGQSPMAFLIEVRIRKACELLRESDLKISNIAEQIGFASPQRFNVAFRKLMGMTPMEFRKGANRKK
jgi:AraC-like DNA-binding protein